MLSSGGAPGSEEKKTFLGQIGAHFEYNWFTRGLKETIYVFAPLPEGWTKPQNLEGPSFTHTIVVGGWRGMI